MGRHGMACGAISSIAFIEKCGRTTDELKTSESNTGKLLLQEDSRREWMRDRERLRDIVFYLERVGIWMKKTLGGLHAVNQIAQSKLFQNVDRSFVLKMLIQVVLKKSQDKWTYLIVGVVARRKSVLIGNRTQPLGHSMMIWLMLLTLMWKSITGIWHWVCMSDIEREFEYKVYWVCFSRL